MKFSFESLNKNFNYVTLKELYEANGDERVYVIKDFFLNLKSEFVKEAPVVAINKVNVNLPQHQLEVVKKIMASAEAMEGIKNGEAGFTIETYQGVDKKTKEPQTYYKIKFVDIEPGTIDEDYDIGDNEE